MNFHPVNMGNIPHPMHMLQQMQPMQAFQHPIMNHSLQMSEDDIVRIATKMNELLSDRIQKLVKTQVEAVIVQIREELNKTKSDLAKVQKELKKVIVKTDDLEQYSRRSCLRITGIKETGNENVTQKVMDLAQSVAAPITLQDIDRVHRVSKSRDDFPDPEEDISDEARELRSREIIVKFTNTSAPLHMLKGRAILRERNAHTYINEDFTKKRRDMTFESRKLKKAGRIDKTWVFNGNVYIKDNGDNKVCITSMEDLDPFQPPRQRLEAGQPV